MPSSASALRPILPGLLLCGAVSAAAYGIDTVEAQALGRAWIEALVLAILLGALVRTAWRPPEACTAGIDFSAKTLLEAAVVLLGLSVGSAAVVAAGPLLIGGIAAIVLLAIGISYGIGRGLGLPHKLAMLIACGNSICGNSAIAATAPVIHAEGEDVAASVAFTAVLGALVVLLLPFAAPILHLDPRRYGILAGLTVYAVPQVLAATAPLGALSVQIGTLVKLVRVLMLGPVLMILSLTTAASDGVPGPSVRWKKVVPPFILGFMVAVAVRATGVLPAGVLALATALATALTVMAMAALGLSVDIRALSRAGARVTVAVVGSLLALGAISLALIAVLPLP